MNNEFYIGWQDKAPKSYAKKIRGTVFMILTLVLLVSGGLVLTQKPFSNSTFEINRLCTLEGILISEPIPCLKMPTGVDAQGIQRYQRVLLIGFGKHGAQPTIEAIEKAQGQKLDGKGLKLEGKLIYFDGKLAMEMSNGLETFKGFTELKDMPSYQQSLGDVTLRGEILDPKCYLGVMRPGEGKPHRSCAIRCIEGGITPLFRTRTSDANQYFFALDENGQPINDWVAKYVADDVQLCGVAEQWDDWYVVKVDLKEGFKRLNPYWAKGQAIPMCNR
ncbi:MAG: hypothetical protein IPJ74_20740 [Saprospiraceae bacterium]|nr:hypothetical protein [Saprospiraceae bacterium]